MSNKIPWNLIVSKLRQTLSENEDADFQKWLKKGDNQQLFKQLEIVWYNIQKKVESYDPDLEYYWKELSARMSEVDINNRIIFQSQHTSNKFGFKRAFKVAAAIILVIILSGIGIYYFTDPQNNKDVMAQSYAAITGKSRFILPDGSEVWLNANSTITYNKSLTSNTREVELTGEAFFNIKSDIKPFIVNAGDLSVRVHGTQFNVNSYAKSEQIVVSLFEGSVSMNMHDNKTTYYLEPGQEGSFNKQNNTINIEEGDVEFAKIWTQDRIRFDNKSLREVCRYLAKWYGTEIQIDKQVSDNQSYTFTLKEQSLDEVIRIMAGIDSIDYYFSDNNTLIITSKK